MGWTTGEWRDCWMNSDAVGVVATGSNSPQVYHTRRCHELMDVEETRVVSERRVERSSLVECDWCRYDWELEELDLGEWA